VRLRSGSYLSLSSGRTFGVNTIHCRFPSRVATTESAMNTSNQPQAFADPVESCNGIKILKTIDSHSPRHKLAFLTRNWLRLLLTLLLDYFAHSSLAAALATPNSKRPKPLPRVRFRSRSPKWNSKMCPFTLPG